MLCVNEVRLIGHLGADPELRFTTAGTPVATLSVATNKVWTDKEGTKQERVAWHRIVCWGTLGELVKQSLHKGSPVYIAGELVNRSWEAKDGSKRYAVEVVAHMVNFLEGRQGELPPPPSDADAPPAGGDDIPF